jgi:hypothetical protein
LKPRTKQFIFIGFISFRPRPVTVEIDAVGVEDELQISAKTETLLVFAAPNGLLQKECFIRPAARNSFTDVSPVFSD